MEHDALRLRPGRPDDAASISVLATHVFVATYAPQGLEPALAREALANYSPAFFAGRLSAPRVSFLLAESAGCLVGFAEVDGASACPVPWPHAPGIELARLYVHPPFHGRGVGRALLAGAQLQAGTAGAASLWLSAWAGNAHALAFYAAQGFQDIGETRHVFERQSFENRVLARRMPPRA